MMAWVVDFEWKEKAAVETERGEVAAGKPDGRRSSGRGTLNLSKLPVTMEESRSEDMCFVLRVSKVSNPSKCKRSPRASL
jgi:hypothetical protein